MKLGKRKRDITKARINKLYQFKKLSDKRYIMDLGRSQISLKLKKPTPFYPKILRLQNRINRSLQRNKFILFRSYKKLGKPVRKK